MSIKVIEFKGKKIAYADHRGLTGQELIKSLDESNKIVIKNKYDLLLADFRDAYLSNEVMDYLKGKEIKEAATYLKKQALIGVSGLSGIRKLAINIYNTVTQSNIKLFENEEEAKEYLTS